MERLRNRGLATLSAIMIPVGIGVGFILSIFFPDYYFAGYPIIPLFFYVMGIATIWVLDRFKHSKATKLVNLYMVVRGVKIAMAVIVIGMYIWLVNEAKTPFLLTFMGFYVVYLIFETNYFYRFERQLKQTQKQPE